MANPHTRIDRPQRPSDACRTRTSRNSTNRGIHRAAAVLSGVNSKVAESVLCRLPDDQADAIRESLQTGGRTVDRADHQQEATTKKELFAFLKDVHQPSLFSVVLTETPQTIAALLSVMPSEYAPKVICALTEPRRIEIVARLAEMASVSVDVARALAAGLRQQIESRSQRREQSVDGIQRIVKILRHCDRSTEWSVMRSLARENPGLTERVQEMLFNFNDIVSLADNDVQVLVKNVSVTTWAMALKRASEQIRKIVFRNLSARAGQHLRSEMDYLGEALPSEIDASHQRIVDVARQLGDNGSIARAA